MMFFVLFFIVLGDAYQAAKNVMKFLTRDSEFIDQFIIQGMKASAALNLTLSWLGAARFSMTHPDWLAGKINPNSSYLEHMKENPSSKAYLKDLKQCYKDGSFTTPKKVNKAKRKLTEILDSDEEAEVSITKQVVRVEAADVKTPAKKTPVKNSDQ